MGDFSKFSHILECHVIYEPILFVQIIFKSGTKVLVNRQNFEWNKSSFSEEFKATTSASEFITVWQRITTVDSRTQQSVRRSESSSPESSQASSSHSTQSTVSVDSEVVPPASKRLCLERPSTVTTGSADHGQSPLHLNPIDDVILSKRMGMLYLTNYMAVSCFMYRIVSIAC